MTAPTTSPKLMGLLQKRPRLERGAEGLLSLLAAVPGAPDAAVDELARRLADETQPDWKGLHAWLGRWSAPPQAPNDLRAWLTDTEDLGLALVALDRLGPSLGTDAAELQRVLSQRLDDLRGNVTARDDHALYAGIAAERLTSLPGPVAPWSWIRINDAEQLLASDDSAVEELLRLATQRRVSAQDEATLATRVSADAELQRRYRDLVKELTEQLFVTRWSEAWSLDVARDTSELDAAAELLRLYLPHANSALSVRQHAEGTWWRYPDGTDELVPFATACHRWGDNVLGALETRIVAHEPSASEDLWHGVANLLRVASGEGGPRGLDVARALAAALGEGPASDAITSAHDAFETGAELDDESERLVSHAFHARLTMTEAAAQLAARGLDVKPLMGELSAADQRHREHGSATFLVPDELHDELTSDLPVDTAEWWGQRAAVEAAVPDGVVQSALVALARDATQEDSPKLVGVAEPPDEYRSGGKVIAFPGAAQSSARKQAAEEWTMRLAAASAPSSPAAGGASSTEPCDWLRAGSSAEPTPGRVPLILYDEKNERGVIADLRVTVVANQDRASAVWAGKAELELLARDTIRAAYRAAAKCTPMGVAPHPFASHRLELVVDPDRCKDARLAIDGDSVGLPAALAFASAWLDQPIARRVVPIGTVSREGHVSPVGFVPKKTAAVVAYAGTAELELVVSEPNQRELEAAGFASQSVSKLPEALRAAELRMDGLTAPLPPSEKARLRALAEHADVVEDGNLSRFGERTTWATVGDQMRDLLDSFPDDTPNRDRLDHYRVLAALAYSHAGLIADVNELLESVGRAACASLEARTLYDIVKLTTHIDRVSLETKEGQAAMANLHADVDELQGGHPRMLGRALGTLGRAHMHSRDLEQALPLLEDAITAHLEHEPHEAGRSRVYYAMALRMAGDPEHALEQLVRARLDLETLTRPYSSEYEASCRTYLDYELARTLVALERYEGAIEPATRALADCPWGPWPQLGLLRVRAWAYRMSSEPERADADVERMRRVAGWLAQVQPELVAALIEEAEGYPVEDGEVY